MSRLPDWVLFWGTLILATVLLVPMAHASGYLIAVTACAAERCVDLPTPASTWSGKYSCDARAPLVADEAAGELERNQPFGLPSPWKVTARCVPAGAAPKA